MKMVSAAKLRRAQQAIQDMRPYANKLQELLSNLLSALDGDSDTGFGQLREVQSAAIVVLTSSRGLCGGFNSNILKAASQLIEEKYAEQRAAKKLKIVCIGKKASDYFRRRYPDLDVDNSNSELIARDYSFADVEPVAQGIMDAFEAGELDAVDIVYSQFKNAAMQEFVVEPFLPVPKAEAKEGKAATLQTNYLFEPSAEELLETLVPSILKTQFFKTALDTSASEHGARMTAMDKATENAEDLLKDLKINYNKARQEAITRELSEIAGGVAALEG